ncbi:alpha/beta fold hydrolase [Saccharomonospora piscinae]|uniref:alpha/beta fold hydrolase n=1 Tax=Saccharomonospora piscinae TaxID=687388 RepID=UPI0004BB3955|nr:alpha/beta hydrolase [Saccharomonospora piscinae]
MTNTSTARPQGRSIYRSEPGRLAVTGWCREQLTTWPLPHERHRLTALGADTHVVEAGPGDRQSGGAGTVVYVPGTNVSVAAQSPLVSALAARRRVVAVDVPGQPGLSDGARIPSSGRLAWYGRWLAEVIDAVADHGPVTVLGHSLGSAITMACPSPRVRHQVLVSPAGLVSLRVTPSVALVSTAWVLRRREADSERLLRLMHAHGHPPRAELVEWMTLVGRHVRSSADPGRAPVGRPDVSRTVLSGGADVFLPPARVAPAVSRALGSPLRVLDGAGHFVVEERPEELAALATAPPAG